MMTARIARKTVICIFWSMSLITSIILFNMSKSNGKLFMLISFLGFGNTFISFAATCCAMCCCDEEQMYHGFLLFCSLFVIISQATILNVYIIAFFRGFRHQVMLMSKHIYNFASRIRRFWLYQFWSILQSQLFWIGIYVLRIPWRSFYRLCICRIILIRVSV